MAWLLRLMPALSGATPRARSLGAGACVVMLLALAGFMVAAAGGAGDGTVAGALQIAGVLAAIVVLAVRCVIPSGERGSCVALAAAVALWCAGVLVHTALGATAGTVDAADALWLLFYPLAYLAVGLRTRATLPRPARSVWLDGLIGMLSVGALGWLVAVQPILDEAPGGDLVTVVNAAYVIGDLVLAALTVMVLGLHGWRPGRAWYTLAAGLAVFAAADSMYLLEVAHGTYVAGTPADGLWGVGILLLSLAAWQPSHAPRPATASLGVLAAPFGFALAALGVLVFAGLDHAAPMAVVLAGAAALVSMARTGLTFKELRSLAEMRRLAATDDLTGLPNRRHLERRLGELVELARLRRSSVALLLIDLDRFKELNDTLGHHAGDLVLARVGPRLRAVLRARDELARLGGDEFAVVLPDAADAECAGRRIADALAEGITVDGIDVRLQASIGIAVFPDHGPDAQTLLRRADVAMYEAKATRSGQAFYMRERDRHSRERLALIGELGDAIGTEQLLLHYQPKLDLATGTVSDVEALVRWMHPEHGLLAPGAFVPLAEQTGAMRRLTDHVLDTALQQVGRWHGRGIHLAVAVNVSAGTLLDEAWAAGVGVALARHDVPASRLRIEITEDALMTDPDRAVRVLERLVALGVAVSLDDFGTGYSSLGLLKHLPVDELKIDRTFVRDVVHDAADAAIVHTVVDLGRRLGLRTVAEGVEDAATLERIAAHGVTTAQGFHIARPLEAAALETWLRTRGSRAA